MGSPNTQSNPLGATPVWLAGGAFGNLATSAYTQVKVGSGVFSGLSVNTAGTASAISLYDGLSSGVTITLASPGVVSWPAHGLLAGSAVRFQTTGALSTGLTAGTTYYVSTLDLLAGSFVVADTQAHALAGTNSVNTSGSQSGVQTAWNVSTLIGTWSTTAQANLPIGGSGALFQEGLISITSDSGGAANATVY